MECAASGEEACVAPLTKACRGKKGREKGALTQKVFSAATYTIVETVLDDNKASKFQGKKQNLEGRFSGRLERKADEQKLPSECRRLAPYISGPGNQGDRSMMTLAKIVRGIVSGQIRRHLASRELTLHHLALRLAELDSTFDPQTVLFTDTNILVDCEEDSTEEGSQEHDECLSQLINNQRYLSTASPSTLELSSPPRSMHKRRLSMELANSSDSTYEWHAKMAMAGEDLGSGILGRPMDAEVDPKFPGQAWPLPEMQINRIDSNAFASFSLDDLNALNLICQETDLFGVNPQQQQQQQQVKAGQSFMPPLDLASASSMWTAFGQDSQKTIGNTQAPLPCNLPCTTSNVPLLLSLARMPASFSDHKQDMASLRSSNSNLSMDDTCDSNIVMRDGWSLSRQSRESRSFSLTLPCCGLADCSGVNESQHACCLQGQAMSHQATTTAAAFKAQHNLCRAQSLANKRFLPAALVLNSNGHLELGTNQASMKCDSRASFSDFSAFTFPLNFSALRNGDVDLM